MYECSLFLKISSLPYVMKVQITSNIKEHEDIYISILICNFLLMINF